MLMTIKFPLKMSERAFVCQLTLLNIDTYSNILIESSINTNEMFSRVNEKRIYHIDITFGINESIFSGNEQQKVYIRVCGKKKDETCGTHAKKYLRSICSEIHSICSEIHAYYVTPLFEKKKDFCEKNVKNTLLFVYGR